MIFRYTVETKHKPSFTASKKVISEEEAESIWKKLRKQNDKEGYSKYSHFILYSDNNKFVCSFSYQ
jgi:hypothetical protein